VTLLNVVERERSRLLQLIATTGVCALVAVAGVLLAIGVVVLGGAQWIELPRYAPFLVWVAVGAAVAGAIWWTRRHASRDASLGGLARAVEEEQALRRGALRGVLEVAQGSALGRRAADQMAETLGKARTSTLAPRVRRRAGVRAAVAVVAGGLASLLLFSRATAAPDGWRAIAHPVRAWTGTLLEPIRFKDMPPSVLRGERVRLTVTAPNRRSIEIVQRATGAGWRRERVTVNDGVARLSVGPMDADLAVYATDGRSASDTATVRVAERPFIGDVSVRAIFPAYLDRREEALPLGEPARIPRGTLLVMAGHSSTELRSVSLARPNDTIPLTINGRNFTGKLSLAQSGTYTWNAVGLAGPIADLPAPLDVEIVPDSAPHVEIIAPARDTVVTPADTITVSVLATDDHALASVSLKLRRVPGSGASEPEQTVPLPAERATQWTGDAPIALGAFHLEAGDELHVVAMASDGSPWNQAGASRELVLHVPGSREQRETARAAGDTVVQRAAAAAAAQKSLQQRTADAAKARDRSTPQKPPANGGSSKNGGNTMSYEAAEQAKALAREQRALTDRVQQLQQQAKQLEKQLREAGALDTGLAKRLQEAQKLLKDALTPELMEQLRKLEESAQKLSPDDARKAMADLAQQQQRLREQLEKSVEMLKRAALEGSMQTLRDEAKEIAKRERAIADSMANGRDAAKQQQSQRDAKQLADRSRDLAQDVAELQKRLERENAEAGAQRANEAATTVKESAQQMQRAAKTATDSANAQRQSGNQQGQQQKTQQQNGQQQNGQQQNGQQQNGQQQNGQQQNGQQQGQKSGQQQQGNGQQQSGQQAGGQQNAGEQRDGAEAAKQAAESMDRAAKQLADAREQQINEWKKELTSELDQSIQEMLQLSRQQQSLEQQARDGADKSSLQSQQSALAQGVQKAGQRLSQAGQKSTLLSQRSQRSVSEAQQKVEQASKELAEAQRSQQAAGSMRDASDALNQAAASLVRDREKAQNASSASGFAEMLQQMREMASQQGSLNAQAAQLLPRPGGQMDERGRDATRALGKQQRDVAASLDQASDNDRTGKTDELAKEARQLAQALESGSLDQNIIERQQRLFRRMLDAGRTLEEDKREDTGKRESRPATGNELFIPPNGPASGKAASRFQAPTWNELRSLTPEERRLVLDYFKRINGERP
jgi:hypothetical protein